MLLLKGMIFRQLLAVLAMVFGMSHGSSCKIIVMTVVMLMVLGLL